MASIGVVLPGPAAFAAWRDQARRVLAAEVPPEQVEWRVAGDGAGLFFGDGAGLFFGDGAGLLDSSTPPPSSGAPPVAVPRAFPALAEVAIRHCDPERFARLYRVLWRLTHGAHGLMEDRADPDIIRLEAMAKSVRRDAHKMHAFLRFRCIQAEAGPHYLAWFEPDHHILHAEADFFVRRFASLRWSIITPEASAHWDGTTLRFGPAGTRHDVPREDAVEDLWRTYYASIFNPARLKPAAMRAEMPKKYWRNLPETRDIRRLIAEAPARAAEMVARGATPPALRRQRDTWSPRAEREEFPRAERDEIPRAERDEPLALSPPNDPTAALAALRAEVLADQTLPWAAQATQAVFGEGPIGARLLFVGEQPGDEEDIAGRPFVGPAGRLFNRALEEAGIPRAETYVTNAVKHFKYTPTGRRRLHQSPDAGDITHYRPFLRREIEIIGPKLVVALGASALRALTGKAGAVGKMRGQVLALPEGPPAFPTVHPSYLLRLPDAAAKAAEYQRFIADLRAASAAAPG
jgi:DNA polymerase